MSQPSKREYLAKIHGRYQRAGRPHKSRILDEFVRSVAIIARRRCPMPFDSGFQGQSNIYDLRFMIYDWDKLPFFAPIINRKS
jgi:hypothetical protein